MAKDLKKILLASSGSQGVVALRELFALGYVNKISVITFESPFNEPFIKFLEFNRIEYVTIKNNIHLDEYFNQMEEVNILLSISFRFIFSDFALKRIRLSAINFHPGILPNYKGSFSIPWSIINNEEKVGYTYHLMISKVDSGNIIYQESFKINNRTAHELNYLVFQKGLSKIGHVLKIIEKKNFIPKKMIGKGKFYPNILPFSGEIDINWDNDKTERYIRAMFFPPFKPAVFKWDFKTFEINSIVEFTENIKKLK